MKHKNLLLILALLTLLAMGLLLAGCGGAETDAANPDDQQQNGQPSDQSQGQEPAGQESPGSQESGQPAGDAGNDLVAAGEEVFADSGCGGCHAINGEGGTSAPDLSQVGGKYGVAEVKAFMQDDHPMPFNGSEEELTALAEYLASLK